MHRSKYTEFRPKNINSYVDIQTQYKTCSLFSFFCIIIISLYFGFSVISMSEREGDPESILYVCIFPTSIKMHYITEVPFVWFVRLEQKMR